MSRNLKPTPTETIDPGYEQLLGFGPESPRPVKVIYRGIALTGAEEPLAPGGRDVAKTGPEQERVARTAVTNAAHSRNARLRRWNAGALGALGVLATAAAIAAAIWLASSGHLPVAAVALLP